MGIGQSHVCFSSPFSNSLLSLIERDICKGLYIKKDNQRAYFDFCEKRLCDLTGVHSVKIDLEKLKWYQIFKRPNIYVELRPKPAINLKAFFPMALSISNSFYNFPNSYIVSMNYGNFEFLNIDIKCKLIHNKYREISDISSGELLLRFKNAQNNLMNVKSLCIGGIVNVFCRSRLFLEYQMQNNEQYNKNRGCIKFFGDTKYKREDLILKMLNTKSIFKVEFAFYNSVRNGSSKWISKSIIKFNDSIRAIVEAKACSSNFDIDKSEFFVLDPKLNALYGIKNHDYIYQFPKYLYTFSCIIEKGFNIYHKNDRMLSLNIFGSYQVGYRTIYQYPDHYPSAGFATMFKYKLLSCSTLFNIPIIGQPLSKNKFFEFQISMNE